MPITMNGLDEAEVASAVLLMTSERLGRYHTVAGTSRGALELHAHAMQVAGSMLAAIGVVEIALRNATGEKLPLMLGRADWLQNPPAGVAWRGAENQSIRKAIRDAKRSRYAALPHPSKMALDLLAFPTGGPHGIGHKHRVRARQDQIIVPEGQVVAQLTFGFWKGLYAEDYEKTLWKRSLRGVFPRKSLSRSDVAKHLETIYQTRNRIAHHESVAGPRVAEMKEAVAFVASNLGGSRYVGPSPLAKLLEPHIALVDEHAEAFEACLAKFKASSASGG